MTKPSLVIFDLDDTLNHSNINYALMKQRVKELFGADYEFKINPTVKELLELLSPDSNLVQKAYFILTSMESESATTAELIPSADKLPNFLKQMKLKSAVLTNNSRASVNKYLTFEKFKFLLEMGPITTRDDVPSMKPDPAGILKIIDQFEYQNRKEEVLFVGDSYIDADASHYAGIHFYLVNTRNLDISKFNFNPDKIFLNLSEFIQFFQKELIDCFS